MINKIKIQEILREELLRRSYDLQSIGDSGLADTPLALPGNAQEIQEYPCRQ